MKMSYASLPRAEIQLYFLVWLCTIGYSIYRVYKVCCKYLSSDFDDFYNDLTDGWSWIGRKKDNADIEWRNALILINKMFPWVCVHLVVSEIIKTKEVFCNQVLSLWHIITGSLFTIHCLGVDSLLCFIAQPLILYFVIQLISKTFIVWLCSIIPLLLLNKMKEQEISEDVDEFYIHIRAIALCWINLRCLNYYLDATRNVTIKKFNILDIIHVLAYCLYLPLLFFGPLIMYSDFIKTNLCTCPLLVQRLKQLMFSLVRFYGWLVFTEFAVHYVYINALTYQVQLLSSIDNFSFYGLGYCLGQFFHVKYVVLYGLSCTVTHFELGITVPQIPKCIGRIHLYSDMWRYFDQGLYKFLVNYIYIPSQHLFGKIGGSLLCFLFVYLWHGTQNHILIWSILNCLGIIFESLCKNLSEIMIFHSWMVIKSDSPSYRRLACLLSSPLFAMSALSNFYFLVGKDIGDLYVQRFIHSPYHVVFLILSALYCGSHVSIQIRQYEQNKIKYIQS